MLNHDANSHPNQSEAPAVEAIVVETVYISPTNSLRPAQVGVEYVDYKLLAPDAH